MADDRICERGKECSCFPDEKNECAFYHMPTPRILSKRTTRQTDFVDRGLQQIKKQNEGIRDQRADMRRKIK